MPLCSTRFAKILGLCDYVIDRIEKNENYDKYIGFYEYINSGDENISLEYIDVTMAGCMLRFDFKEFALGHTETYTERIRAIVDDRNNLKHASIGYRDINPETILRLEFQALNHIKDLLDYLLLKRNKKIMIKESISQESLPIFRIYSQIATKLMNSLLPGR